MEIVWLGEVGYREALDLQLSFLDRRAARRIRDTLLLLTHPHVYTLGRGGDEANLLVTRESLAAEGIPVERVGRGGDITYHGPGQLVGYPIVLMEKPDVHRFVRSIEAALIDAMRVFGVESRRIEGLTGVWAGERKIASIGVGIRKWVTYHGFALNVTTDLSWFRRIQPVRPQGTGGDVDRRGDRERPDDGGGARRGGRGVQPPPGGVRMNPGRVPRPDWLKVRAPSGKRVEEVSGTLARLGLRTVCREARCPNVGECWGAGTATVILLGDVCTRGCAFCGVTAGVPAPVDPCEPDRVARAAAELSWRHVVVTSVTRDDLPDGGAEHFASVVRALRREAPEATVELLVPDFGGSVDALRCVVGAAPDILAHNVETVPRLYPAVRKDAVYDRSLDLLRRAAVIRPSLLLKSGIMLGFGETEEEVATVFRDLFAAGCRSITIGQYLPPSRGHLPVSEYVTPERFGHFGEAARAVGFERVLSGPLVRSSYYRAG